MELNSSLESQVKELQASLETIRSQVAEPTPSDIVSRQRVLELESLVDEQTIRIQALVDAKAESKHELSVRMQEKDTLIESYEARILELQTAFQDKVFAVNETKNLDEVHRLQRESELAKREIMELKTRQALLEYSCVVRLEISEQTRKSVHETTMTILKQAQEDSAKIAMSHHQQAMNALLLELRQEALSQKTGIVDHQVHILQSQLSSSELECQGHKSRILELEQTLENSQEIQKELQSQIAELSAAKKQLSLELQDSKNGWPPSMHQFDSLVQKIQDLEACARKRESEIESLIKLSREDASQAFEEDRQELLRVIHKKDEEIRGFKTELDSMVNSILELKRQGLSIF